MQRIKDAKVKIKGARFTVVGLLVLGLFLGLVPDLASAGTLKATPRVKIKYTYNDNFYADDLDQLDDLDRDPATASYLTYLVGLQLDYYEGRHTFSVRGDAGYEQWISLDGYVTDLKDDDPNEYSAMSLAATAEYMYVGNAFTFELGDDIRISRDLGEVFGAGTDAVGYWSLYTNNTIRAGVRFRPSGKSNILLRYSYNTLTFEDPENDIRKPADSFQHDITARGEYNFSTKTVGIIDLKAIMATFEEVDNRKNANYDLYMAMAGIRYHFSSYTYVQVLGGGAWRTFDDLSDQTLPLAWPAPYGGMEMYDLEDTTDWIADVKFYTARSQNYTLTIHGQKGVSTYGQNMFFDYVSGSADFLYYFSPKVSAGVVGGYRQVTYDIDENGRDWLWDDMDRVDNIMHGTARVRWDIFQKGGQGTLTLEGGYSYMQRDSNVDDPEDYNPVYASFLPLIDTDGDLVGDYLYAPSFDTVTNIYYVQVTVLPSILIGD